MSIPQFGFGTVHGLSFYSGAAPSTVGGSLADAAYILAFRMKAQTANAITHVRFSAFKAAGTSPTYKVSLQSIDANGNPTGTILGGGTPASATFTVSSGTPAVQDIALANSYTPSIGDAFAVTIEHESGTIDFSNYVNFIVGITAASGDSQHFAVTYTTDGSNWVNGGVVSGCVVRTASERYGGAVITGSGMESFTQASKTVSTSGHRACAKFVLPAASYISSFNVSGFLMRMELTAGQSVKAGIWNAAGTELKAVTVDTDYAGSFGGQFPVEFDSVLSVAPGDTIYVGLESVSNSTAKIFVMDFANTSDRDATRGLSSGANLIYSSWNGSAWTDSGTDVPYCELMVSGITGASAGGGGLGMVIGG